MFETAEVGSRIDKETFRQAEPAVRAGLLEVQRRISGPPSRR